MPTPYELGQQQGLTNSTIENIRAKAETNTPLQTPSAEKQSVYDAYQAQYVEKIKQQAQAGTGLVSPNAYKQSIYDQYAQKPSNAPQGTLPIDQYLAQAQSNSQTQLDAMRQYLEQSAQAQLQGQQAQLGFSRDEELAQIQQALSKAIADGQLSIRQAEEQFAQAKAGIEKQAYVDSELTNLTASDRGIQNSAQFIGLQQGDAYRRDSLLNQNVTERDRAINEINQQLNQLNYDAGINTSLANSRYNYGLAGAQADIQGNLSNQLANLSYEEYARLQQQGFDLNTLGLQQGFQLDTLAKQQEYDRSNQVLQQQFSLEQLNAQQRNTLEQLATSQGYDLERLSVQQQYQLAQLAQSFGYDFQLQQSNQGFQAGQNALDRNATIQLEQLRQSHDFALLNAEQQAQFDQYEVELGRKLAQYQPGTRENALLTSEYDFALQSLQRESAAQIANDIGAKKLASLLESYPELPKDLSNKKAVDEYNSKVDYLNGQVTDIVNGKGFEYTQDRLKATSKYKEEEKSGFLDAIKQGIKSIRLPSNFLP